MPRRPVRNDASTPKAQGVAVDGDELVPAGPRTWDEVLHIVAEGGKNINLKEKALLKRTGAEVKNGGHHLVDEMIPGGVQARAVSESLADELFGHEGALIDGSAGEIA